MQILHPFIGSVQQYLEQLADPDQPRPAHGPQCQAKQPLAAHGFYTRTLIDTAFDGSIRVRRYLCQAGRRTVSLLPEFAMPYLRSSVTVIALLLIARLLPAQTLAAALPPSSPYQRGQFWLRRCRAQAEALCAALAALTKPAPESGAEFPGSLAFGGDRQSAKRALERDLPPLWLSHALGSSGLLKRWFQPPDAENRTSGGVGGCRGAIPVTRPDRRARLKTRKPCDSASRNRSEERRVGKEC